MSSPSNAELKLVPPDGSAEGSAHGVDTPAGCIECVKREGRSGGDPDPSEDSDPLSPYVVSSSPEAWNGNSKLQSASGPKKLPRKKQIPRQQMRSYHKIP